MSWGTVTVITPTGEVRPNVRYKIDHEDTALPAGTRTCEITVHNVDAVKVDNPDRPTRLTVLDMDGVSVTGYSMVML